MVYKRCYISVFKQSSPPIDLCSYVASIMEYLQVNDPHNMKKDPV